jgi:transposase
MAIYRKHPRNVLTDSDWEKVRPHFPKRTRPGTGRLFLEAVIFKARTGIPWRDLPERFGDWNATFRRFSRWSERGFFETLRLALRDEIGIDVTEASLDSTAVKLHASGHGAKKKSNKTLGNRAVGGQQKSMHSSMPTAD